MVGNVVNQRQACDDHAEDRADHRKKAFSRSTHGAVETEQDSEHRIAPHDIPEVFAAGGNGIGIFGEEADNLMPERKNDHHKKRTADQNQGDHGTNALFDTVVFPCTDILTDKRSHRDGQRLDREPGKIVDFVSDIVAGSVSLAEGVYLGNAEDHAEGNRCLLQACRKPDAKHIEKKSFFAAKTQWADGKVGVPAVDVKDTEEP